MKIKTNYHHRPTLQAYELTPAERDEFDYIDWPAVERGEESATFLRYKGVTYDLGDTDGPTSPLPADSPLRAWDSYISDSFFSGIVVRWNADDDYETVTVGTYFA